ncbi:sulfate permease 2 [Lindgomyces ingoldianus]|uniref:Sulfate permease 2 n=1 Tax=Lindgomyces ingoldianus TaxID=673940 RepID=A0ACB6QVM5_9PLEO|nr:sulfate permease 2 [Lindgomyces ingoldianus]KAF2470897.1 sulfate permease 2 [Lindgomyces ingoldianus]
MAGRFLAKILSIDTENREERRGPLSSGPASLDSADTYVESEPTTKEFLLQYRPTTAGFLHYIRTLFPFWNWIFHYNLTWLLGDVIAGVTVGFVVIPQGMAYALLAKLPAEYGLYTSFVGFLLYWAFATSKDITIGTVAVMSTIVGNIVIKVQKKHKNLTADQIARSLALVSGAVLLFIGLTRLGWIVEFIPLVAITSFMTGAAISIAAGQVPTLLGIPNINNREATYKVIINSLKHLPEAKKLDAALGVSALAMLYAFRILFSVLTKKVPSKKKLWFFLSTLRMAFVIILYILISWGCNRHVKDAKKAKFKILGTVPRGFKHHGVPNINTEVLSAVAPDIPVTVIVLILEHIAISKSFGRINNYVINPSQELVAVGFTNLFGPFLGAYPATGSFSRTAIKAKAGVRTPLAGIFTAVIVLLALYALTSVFFYIPSAALAAIIIHAVLDLITPPAVVYQFWQTSPLEVFIFFIGVFITIFSTIENGIYFTIAASAALLLFRHIKAHGAHMGKVHIYRGSTNDLLRRGPGSGAVDEKISREAYIPLTHSDGSNPAIDVHSPYPGVYIYRFSEGFTYLNQAQYLDDLTQFVQKHSRPTILDRYEKLGDRPWNDPGPRRGVQINPDDDRPVLRAIILDFSSVNNVDTTSVQGLVDVRHQLDRYAAPNTVEWHFAGINNRWTKRALTAAGFGYLLGGKDSARAHWNPVVSYVAIGEEGVAKKVGDEETGHTGEKKAIPGKLSTLHGLNRPFFHIDVQAAVESVIANVRVEGKGRGVGVHETGSVEKGIATAEILDGPRA